jgi:hypothetical protein
MALNTNAQSIGLKEHTSAHQQAPTANDNSNTVADRLVAIEEGVAAGPTFGRQSAVAATSSIASNATVQVKLSGLGGGGHLYAISTSVAAAVRIYKSKAAAIADQSFTLDEDPEPNSGCFVDIETTSGNLSWDVENVTYHAKSGAGSDTAVWANVRNLSGGSSVVTVTLTHLIVETVPVATS